MSLSMLVYNKVSPSREKTEAAFQRCFKKMCSENMLQIYWKTAMPKCDFNKCHFNFIEITLRHGCSPVNLLHNFRTPFLKNTSGRLPLTKWWVLLSCIISAVVQEIKFIFQDYCNGILFSCSLFLLLFVVLTPFVLRHFFTAKVITGSVISRSVFRNLSNI